MIKNIPMRYCVGAVAPTYEGTTYLMSQHDLCLEILATVVSEYTVNPRELGCIREAVLAASVAYNRN